MGARKFYHCLILVIGLTLLFGAAQAYAAIPQTITYDGRLSRVGGGAVEGDLDITISIYNQRSGGAPLWTEAHPAVPVVSGQFTIELGSIEPLNLPFDEPYYIGVTVATDQEMTPRLPFTSVGYAMNAIRAQNADRAQNANNAQNSQNAARADTVADGSITLSSFSATMCNAGEVIRKTTTGWGCDLAVGPIGPMGPIGPTGPVGSIGPQGQQGPQGLQGPEGVGLGNIENVALVAMNVSNATPGPALFLGPDALESAIQNMGNTWCLNPSTPRCLIKAMPGIYRLSSMSIDRNIDIEGSGEDATVLNAIDTQVANGRDVRIRSLTITSSGRILNAGSLTLSQVKIGNSVNDPTNNIVNATGAVMSLYDAKIMGTSGIYNDGGRLTIKDSSIDVDNIGVATKNGGTSFVSESIVKSHNSTGLGVFDPGNSALIVKNADIEGSDYAIVNGGVLARVDNASLTVTGTGTTYGLAGDGSSFVSGTMIQNGVFLTGGSVKCVGSFNQAYLPLAADCTLIP